MTNPVRQSQHKLGTLGEIVEGLDELEQSLRVVIGTPLGSVPGRPTFGSRLYEYVDEPVDALRPLVVRESMRALSVCEPRVQLLQVTVTMEPDGHYTATFRWQPSATSGLTGVRATEVTI